MAQNFTHNSLILKLVFSLVVLLIGVGLWFTFSFKSFADVARLEMDRACSPVIGLPGTEDMVVNGASGRVFISSMDRRKALEETAPAEAIRGRIALFDPENPLDSASWRDRTGGLPESFSPLGMSLYEGKNTKRLFVVNETPAAILMYDVSAKGDLTFLRSFTDPRLNSPNSVVAMGPNSFYVTNDTRAGRGTWLGQLHFFLKLKSGSVFHFDGQSWSETATGLGFANGIAKSADEKMIFVAETSAARIAVFKRNPETGLLQPIDEIALNTFPDNLSMHADGTLLFAAHPRPLSLPSHLREPETLSPSEIGELQIEMEGTGDRVGDPVSTWINDGSMLSGSTVAVEVGRKLLIGALYEDKFLLCE